MKKLGLTILNILILVVLCEFICWTTVDLLIYNTKALDYGLELLYYTSAALMALVLSYSLARLFNRIPVLLRYLMFVLINTYVLVSIQQLFAKYCEEIKNLNTFYSSIIILILIVIGYLVIFKIIPRLKFIGIITVAISTLLAFIDFLFLLYGYRIFYPGFW